MESASSATCSWGCWRRRCGRNRSDGHGEAWQLLVAHDSDSQELGRRRPDGCEDPRALERRGVVVPLRRVQRYLLEVCGRSRGRGPTVRVADGETGDELQVHAGRRAKNRTAGASSARWLPGYARAAAHPRRHSLTRPRRGVRRRRFAHRRQYGTGVTASGPPLTVGFHPAGQRCSRCVRVTRLSERRDALPDLSSRMFSLVPVGGSSASKLLTRSSGDASSKLVGERRCASTSRASARSTAARGRDGRSGRTSAAISTIRSSATRRSTEAARDRRAHRRAGPGGRPVARNGITSNSRSFQRRPAHAQQICGLLGRQPVMHRARPASPPGRAPSPPRRRGALEHLRREQPLAVGSGQRRSRLHVRARQHRRQRIQLLGGRQDGALERRRRHVRYPRLGRRGASRLRWLPRQAARVTRPRCATSTRAATSVKVKSFPYRERMGLVQQIDSMTTSPTSPARSE